MCGNCKNDGIARRDLLKLGAASILGVGLGGVSRAARAAEGAPTKLSPDEALSALKAGNKRYVTHPKLCSKIGAMIEPILPATLAMQKEPGDFVTNTARESAKRTAARLAASSTLITGLIDAGKLKVTSAIYDLKTGVVSYLD
jgi:hypothetical protein